MIAGEQISIPIQERHAAGGVSRDRDDLNVLRNDNRLAALHNPFRIGNGGEIGAMNKPRGAKPLRIARGIGHIIRMGEKNLSDPAHALECVDQMFNVAG